MSKVEKLLREDFPYYSKLDRPAGPVVECGFDVVDPAAGPTQAQQHFKDECNINLILAKYKKTGVIEHVARTRAMYGDFSQYTDIAGSLDKVAKANQMFDDLPAAIRGKFGNSPKEFLDFIGKKENFDQCVEFGIFDKPKPLVVSDIEREHGQPVSEPPTPAVPAEPADPGKSKKKAP